MRTEGVALASGEEVLRRYACTVAGRYVEIAGSVLPFGRDVPGEGVITLTDRRLMLDAETGRRKDGSPSAVIHQEMPVSEASCISTAVSRAPRGVLLPIALAVLGLILMLVPCAAAAADGSFDVDGDYQDGYNDGIEAGYYYGYLHEVQNRDILTESKDIYIPEGYHFDGKRENASAEYDRGYDAGYARTSSLGTSDAVLGRAFSVPTGLMTHNDPWPPILAFAAAGAVLLILGSLVYSLSGTVGEWASVRIGSSGRGIYVTSVSGGRIGASHRGMSPSEGYDQMVRDLGAALVEARRRPSRTTAIRAEDGVPHAVGMVDRGEEGGVDEAVPDIYGTAHEDASVVLGRDTEEGR